MKYFLTVIIIGGLIVIFAVQNAGPAKVRLLFWEFDISLTLLVSITFIIGAILGMTIAFLYSRKRASKRKNT
jgi:uncharacterized integral membrane protein